MKTCITQMELKQIMQELLVLQQPNGVEKGMWRVLKVAINIFLYVVSARKTS